MGSILAETIEAERIDSAISSIKDLFGAIFFVSVGMMVSPADLVEHWLPIVVLVFSILLGQAIFGTIGYLLSGSSRQDAMMSGFSMAQIGEFAFIIAALGESLGVTDGMLMPIVVTTSIITTFLTPYMIKLAQRLVQIHPQSSLGGREQKVSQSSKKKVVSPTFSGRSVVFSFLRKVFLHTLIYSVLSMAVVSLLFVSLLLICRSIFGHWMGNAVCGVLVLTILSPLLRPIVMKSNNSREARAMRRLGGIYRYILQLIIVIRLILATSFVFYILEYLSPFKWYVHIVVSVFVIFLMMRNQFVKRWSMRMEQTFMENLTRRETSNGPEYARQLKGRDLHIARLTLPEGSTWAGKTLSQLRIGGRNGVHVAAIVRDHRRLNIPGGGAMLFPHDVIEVVGDDQSIENFSQQLNAETIQQTAHDSDTMELQCIVVAEDTALEGVLIKDSGIRDQYRCMVVGFEDRRGNMHVAGADHKITHSPSSTRLEALVPSRDSRGERSPWLPLETRPDSPGEPGMHPRDPCRPWRGKLGPGHTLR